MEDNSVIPQGYLLADGRDTTGTEDELLTKYPLLYAYLGNTNVLPCVFDHSKLSDYEDITLSTDSSNPTTMDYDGYLSLRCNGALVSSADYGFDVYVNGVMVASSHNNVGSAHVYSPGLFLAVNKGDLVYVNRSLAISKACFYKSHKYIKAVSGIETASTEAQEVVNAITNATSLLEQDIQDNIGTYATDAVNTIVNDKTTLAEAANTYTQAVVANTQFADSLLNYEEIWFYARRGAAISNECLPVMKLTHDQIVDCLTTTGSYSILLPGYGSEYRQMKFNSTAEVVTAVAGGECVYKVIGYRKRS
jgi:hypothetical protein